MTIQSQVPISRCTAHPEVETALKCSKCGIPICPRCLVQTPVGGRCAKCANLKTLPIFQVGARDYAKAAGAALLSASVLGAIWATIPYGGFFAFILAAGVGYLLSEVVSRAANYKRSLGLQVISGASVVVAYIIANAGPTLMFLSRAHSLDADNTIKVVFASAIAILTNPFALLIVGLGIFVAVNRLR